MQTLVVHKQKGIGKGSSCAMNLISTSWSRTTGPGMHNPQVLQGSCGYIELAMGGQLATLAAYRGGCDPLLIICSREVNFCKVFMTYML